MKEETRAAYTRLPESAGSAVIAIGRFEAKGMPGFQEEG